MISTRLKTGRASIGAVAVVAGKVPDYALVEGNPAQVVRLRFPPDAITRLLALGRWDWPLALT